MLDVLLSAASAVAQVLVFYSSGFCLKATAKIVFGDGGCV